MLVTFWIDGAGVNRGLILRNLFADPVASFSGFTSNRYGFLDTFVAGFTFVLVIGEAETAPKNINWTKRLPIKKILKILYLNILLLKK